ncbi:molybdate ABC transporter substrate-binding protein [Bradyrhizobium sp. RDT10]
MTLTRLILINSILTLLMFGNAEAAEIDVAVAANFTIPSKEMQRRLSRRLGEALLSFGASGQFYSQITQGAPFEVFLSADNARPSKLLEKRLAVPESRFTYAIGNLVLWSSTQKFVNDAETFAKRSIYNPAAALYGAAAEHAIKALGAYESTQPKLVAGFSPLWGGRALAFTFGLVVGWVLYALSFVVQPLPNASVAKLACHGHGDVRPCGNSRRNVVLEVQRKEST